MARADLLKRLFRSHSYNDDEAFYRTALQIVEEERKKNHVILANDLLRILQEKGHPIPNTSVNIAKQLAPLPKDNERDMALVDIKIPQRGLDSVALHKQQQQLLERVIDEYREWDVLAAFGLRPSSNLLFFGPPGCGKTVTAEAIAYELGIPLLYVRFDSLITSLLGETASNLRRVFEYAEKDRWVVFFDEFDAIGRSRSNNDDHPELRRVVNTFLQLLDGFSGQSLVIAATNNQAFIDDAIWRRFDEVVHFQFPNQDQVAFLVDSLLGSWLAEPLEANLVRRMTGLSHADIERAFLSAKRKAVLRGTKSIASHDLEVAVGREIQRAEMISALSEEGGG